MLGPHKRHPMSLRRCVEEQILAKEIRLRLSRSRMAAHFPPPASLGAHPMPVTNGAQIPPLFDPQPQEQFNLHPGELIWNTLPQHQPEQVLAVQQAHQVQQGVQDLAQQQTDRRAQRLAVLRHLRRPQTAQQQLPASSQASQVLDTASPRTEQPSQITAAAWLASLRAELQSQTTTAAWMMRLWG